MKKIYLFLSLAFIACSSPNNSEIQQSNDERYKDSVIVLKAQLEDAYKQIELLKYPANQRLSNIINLFNAGDYKKAKDEIKLLGDLFPHSEEVKAAQDYLAKIVQKEVELEAEKERIKSLGFKAIVAHTKFKIDYNTISLSNISIGKHFTFDYRSDEWTYRDADRGSKYVSALMAVTSIEHDPQLPQLALYSITGSTMNFVKTFDTEFARWSDYGSYLGNYHDSSNDFAKVSTVKFKVGAQINDEILNKAYAIVIKKENGLNSSYNRFNNPPKSYVGSVSYPQTLSIEDFSEEYLLVKLYNL